MDEGAWGWSTTVSPTHAGPQGQPVPTRLAANEERIALGTELHRSRPSMSLKKN